MKPSTWSDPRLYQIAVLGSLLTYGVLSLDLEVRLPTAVAIIATALAAQFFAGRLAGRSSFDPLSALISALSLCLLLRTEWIALAMLAAIIAIASKFVIRVRGKHVFNPTNSALVVMMLVSDRVWVSPGQWGSAAVFAFLLASAGALVVNRASRADVTLTFLGAWATLLILRSLWLGDPLAIPLHRLANGALVLFAFFMISDPKTTPSSRPGRILFAILVALGAYTIQFKLFHTNALLWSLAGSSLFVPLIDRLLPGPLYQWSTGPICFAILRWSSSATLRRTGSTPRVSDIASPTSEVLFALSSRSQRVPVHRTEAPMKHVIGCLALLLVLAPVAAPSVLAFCGFYIAKADTKLFNQASQVVLVRNEDKTVITMANDFKGDPKEFAIVVPVPTVLEKGQIRVSDRALVAHLDAYTAPRLVEYFDPDPCQSRIMPLARQAPMSAAKESQDSRLERAKSLGVTIEAQYTVGEYDILILSARESAGLETWLRDNGYRIPAGASAVLGSYLKQGMKFFVARVNLKEQARLGFTYLRPLQMAFESPKFMLPIRLGTVNADGPQDLFVFALTRKGRVETTNYRTVKLPTGMDLPEYVKEEFPQFYRAMFTEQVKHEDMRAVFLEYAWDMAWCDPCAADPLSVDELRKLGVFWVPDTGNDPSIDPLRRRFPMRPVDTFVTRLHVRYDAAHFPDDLVFQETSDRANYQGRYVLRHPFKGEMKCEGVDRYRESLRSRAEQEATALASLTGWPIDDIRRRMGPVAAGQSGSRKWWQKLFGE